jgi:hypothetical protein
MAFYMNGFLYLVLLSCVISLIHTTIENIYERIKLSKIDELVLECPEEYRWFVRYLRDSKETIISAYVKALIKTEMSDYEFE